MFKKTILLITLFLSFAGSVQALNEIDKFYINHGLPECNGEGPDCNDFFLQTDTFSTPFRMEF